MIAKRISLMSTQARNPSFPESQQDISRLKQTATDAASDLSSTIAVHSDKARGHLHDLAGHVQEEGGQQIERLKEKLYDLTSTTRTYVADRPLTCLAAAFAVGLLIGFSRHKRRTRN
jgi:ElaB/YqjD/DUF883 family membrane-anchored ribosome-binding protein